MKKFSIIIILLFCLHSVLPAQNESPNILVIHSYNPDYPWTSNLDRGLTNTLIERYPFISLDKEFYDSKRYPVELVESPFYNHIKKKYEHKDFDIVLTSDDNALRFYLKYREELFPNTPCVFSGINNIDLYDFKKMDKITGISEDSDFVANLELIENLPLNIDTIAVISDPTTTGSADLIKFREISEPFKSRFDFIELVDLSIEELLSALEELSPTTAIFFISFWRDINNKPLEPAVIIPKLAEVSQRPVIGAWDFFITGGAFGGIAINSYNHGVLQAEYAIKVLEGIPPGSIPIFRGEITTPYFNYQAVKKFGLKISDLPEGTVLFNTPDTLYFNNPQMFRAILIVIVVLTVMVSLLTFNTFRKKQIETALRKTLKEKQILLQEIHHRVKNNLQTISSLLNLQLYNISDEEASKAIMDSQNRIEAMAQAHKKLYESDSLDDIDFGDYIRSLSRILAAQGPEDLIVETNCSEVPASIDISVPVGLILNELITNSIKYAFNSVSDKKIIITCSRIGENNLLLTYTDSGPGFDLETEKHTSLGLQLVEALLLQLRAEMKYDNSDRSKFLINIKLN